MLIGVPIDWQQRARATRPGGPSVVGCGWLGGRRGFLAAHCSNKPCVHGAGIEQPRGFYLRVLVEVRGDPRQLKERPLRCLLAIGSWCGGDLSGAALVSGGRLKGAAWSVQAWLAGPYVF